MQYLLLALTLASVAAGLQHNVYLDIRLDQDSFECPAECWECCTAHKYRTPHSSYGMGASEEEFKCVLRNASQLPSNYKCEDPLPRKHESKTFKTYCTLNTNRPWWVPKVVDSAMRRRRPLRNLEKCETESRIEKFADWLWQKKGELFNLANPNMAEMGSIISTIRLQGHKEFQVLPLSALSSIHPIDEAGAIEKTAGRARAARTARSTLDESPYTLTKELIKNHPDLKPFQSVTGFYVVKLAEGEYVTFEGNGRCVALQWAFPEGDGLRDRLNIEVTEFVIDNVDQRNKIRQRITALQKAMGSNHFAAMYPPSLDPDAVSEWSNGVKAELKKRMSTEP